MRLAITQKQRKWLKRVSPEYRRDVAMKCFLEPQSPRGVIAAWRQSHYRLLRANRRSEWESQKEWESMTEEQRDQRIRQWLDFHKQYAAWTLSAQGESK